MLSESKLSVIVYFPGFLHKAQSYSYCQCLSQSVLNKAQPVVMGESTLQCFRQL